MVAVPSWLSPTVIVALAPAESVAEEDRNEFADAQFNSDMLEDDGVPSVPSLFPPVEMPDAPDFVRHADRRARWQSPRMRAGLLSAALVLTGSLTLQVLAHERDRLVAAWPSLAPPVATACRWLNCRIDAPRVIADVTVESSALSRMADESEAFRLAITLRNRGAVAVAMPSVELSLTDAGGRLISRRAVSPAEFQAAGKVLPAGSEVPLQLALSTPDAKVTGYTVEVFYP